MPSGNVLPATRTFSTKTAFYRTIPHSFVRMRAFLKLHLCLLSFSLLVLSIIMHIINDECTVHSVFLAFLIIFICPPHHALSLSLSYLRRFPLLLRCHQLRQSPLQCVRRVAVLPVVVQRQPQLRLLQTGHMVEQIAVQLSVHVVLLAQHAKVQQKYRHTGADHNRLIPDAIGGIGTARLALSGRPAGRTAAEIRKRRLIDDGRGRLHDDVCLCVRCAAATTTGIIAAAGCCGVLLPLIRIVARC